MANTKPIRSDANLRSENQLPVAAYYFRPGLVPANFEKLRDAECRRLRLAELAMARELPCGVQPRLMAVFRSGLPVARASDAQ